MVATPLAQSILYTGLDNTVVYWVPTIAAKATPLRTELDAGTDLTHEIPGAGISGFSTTGKTVTADNLKDGFDATVNNGFSTSTSSIQVYESENSTADVRTLLHRNDSGFIVIFDNQDVATHFMDVYPVQVLSVEKNRDASKVSMVTVAFTITSAPAENVAVPT